MARARLHHFLRPHFSNSIPSITLPSIADKTLIKRALPRLRFLLLSKTENYITGVTMVKFLSQNHTYDYCFPTVTLAYFLRYPNPFSTHVISTDVIERSFDDTTQRLSTTRLHLKRSKMPSAIMRLLPRSLLGATTTGESQSYVLERSTVDVREGWMMTESRNLEMTNLLSVVERQEYRATGNEEPAVATASASILPVEALRFGTDTSLSLIHI